MTRLSAAVALTASTLAVLAAAPSARTTIPAVFTTAQTAPPGGIPCTVQTGANTGVRLCSASPRSTVKTFDGVPIDVIVLFPPEPARGPDGPYPMVGIFPGWGPGKTGLGPNSRRWLDRGYAVFSMTDRGFRESCGTPQSRSADPSGCALGYTRLMDTRYEVRDVQHFVGLLVDEGLIDPREVAATGGSYGGGKSVALAVLRNRVMLPDGTLIAWRSPAGIPMEIAAAAASSPWSDLAEWLVPNGSTLDYVAQAPYFGPQHRIGVLKEAWFQTLYAIGQSSGLYAPSGSDPDADLVAWNEVLNAGGPYDGNPVAEDFVAELTSHHSAYYIPDTLAPAPMLLNHGWNDDIAPADEGVRLYNKVRSHFPETPIKLFDADIGHAGRSQSKPADMAQLQARQNEWIDYYVRRVGAEPQDALGGVDVMTTTCPFLSASAGPFHAQNWAQLAPGEIRFHHAGAKTIALTGTQFGDIFGEALSGGPCGTSPATDNAATANYRLGPAPAPGFTIAGSPTVIANFRVTGANDQVAARLLDVDPASNTQQLIARGLWRPEVSTDTVRQVFQLHAQAYKMEPGHLLKLELLPDDSPYGRANPTSPDQAAQHPILVRNLMLRVPVLEQPCALGGLVNDPAAKFVPFGYQLAIDVPLDPWETKC